METMVIKAGAVHHSRSFRRLSPGRRVIHILTAETTTMEVYQTRINTEIKATDNAQEDQDETSILGLRSCEANVLEFFSLAATA